MEDIFVPIFLFGATALVLWKYYDGRHRERMAMIEKGITPTQAQTGWLKQFVSNPLSNLKWGLLGIFVGIGIFVGHWLHEALGINDGAAFFGSALISGGVALVIYYFIASRKTPKLD
jgi:hypothetical protein